MDDYFDQVFRDFDEERAIDAVRRAREAADKAKMEAFIQAQLLEAYRAWRDSRVTDTTAARRKLFVSWAKTGPKLSSATGTGPARSRQSPTGREAILAFFTEHPDERLSLRELAEKMGLTEQDHHRLGVSLSRLATDGQLARPSRGVYQLPPATVTAAAGEEREADSDNGSQNGSGPAVGSSDLFGLAGPAPGTGPGSSS